MSHPSGPIPTATAQTHLDRRVVAILGGGLSGAAVAYHLARQTDPRQLDIVVIEPREILGAGLAYSTPDDDHRLNVPDHKMSLDKNAPDDFRRWLHLPEAPLLPAGSATLRGEVFAPRRVFAAYAAARLQPFVDAGRVRHIQATATRVNENGDGSFAIDTDRGGVVLADQIVISITHPAPRLPAELALLRDHPALIPDAYAAGALDKIRPQDRVLILGTGLTGADVVASLQRRGHHSRITMLSRHGRFSQPHGPVQAETSADFASQPATTARGLLASVRRALAHDAAQGLTWHATFDRLRAQGPAIWGALSLTERRRFLRHLRGLWDVHRFRIAPQTHDVLTSAIASRKVLPLAGRVQTVRSTDTGVRALLRLRASQEQVTIEVDHVVLATGPSHGDAIAQSGVLTSLANQGLITKDALGLGLSTAPNGEAIGLTGASDPRILIGGPLARGTVGELMGVPEVTGWAEKIATQAARHVALSTQVGTAAE